MHACMCQVAVNSSVSDSLPLRAMVLGVCEKKQTLLGDSKSPTAKEAAPLCLTKSVWDQNVCDQAVYSRGLTFQVSI